VVTGASSGIGAALAAELAARGHSLILVARRGDRLEALAGDLRARCGVSVEVRACDLGNEQQRGRLRDELASRQISVLCNNAGFPVCGQFAEQSAQALAEEVSVNVVALHELTRAVLPGMLARRRGAILLTGSTAGEQPVPTGATYAATKAFVNTLSESLHAELRGTGVTCTLLAPGPVRTEFASVGGIADAEAVGWMLWSTPQRVAVDAVNALERGRRVVRPGPAAKAQALAGRWAPRWLLFAALRSVVLPALRKQRSA
jgi:short-subunit dehydrogenase